MSIKIIWLSIVLTGATIAMAGNDLDTQTGLIKAEGWEAVRNNCIACHNAKLIIQNRGTRSSWDNLITWMQQTQNLWPLDADTRETIVGYLATHYATRKESRRAPLERHLLPANPYK